MQHQASSPYEICGLEGLWPAKLTPQGDWVVGMYRVPEPGRGYDLRLMSVATTEDLVNEGSSLVIVALVGVDLHIRIFNASGKMVIDKPESELLSGQALTDLKALLDLDPFPDDSTLSREQTEQIINNATSSAGHTPGRLLRCFQAGGTGEEEYATSPFDVPDGTMIGHEMRISPDGKWVTVSCPNKILRMFSVPDLEEKHKIETPGDVNGVAWSPDSRTLATGYNYPWSLDLWEVSSGNHIRSLAKSQNAPTMDLCYSPDGSLLGIAEKGGRIIVWDTRTMMEQHVFAGHSGTSFSLSFTADSKTLVSGDRELKLWDVSRPVKTDLGMASETHELWNVVYSPDGRILATTAADGVVRLFDVKTEALIKELSPSNPVVPTGGWLRYEGLFPGTPLCFFPDSRTLVAGNGDHTATVYDILTGARFVLEGKSEPFLNLRISPDGRTIAATGDGVLFLFDATTGVKLDEISERGETIQAVDFFPGTGKRLVAYVSIKELMMLDLDTMEKRVVPSGGGRSVTFSPDGKLLAIGSEGWVELRAMSSLELVAKVDGNRGIVRSVSFSPDGSTLAIPCTGGLVQLWNLNVMGSVGYLPVPEDWIMSAEFSPDGRSIAVSSLAHGVQQFHAPTWEGIAASRPYFPRNSSPDSSRVPLREKKRVVADAKSSVSSYFPTKN